MNPFSSTFFEVINDPISNSTPFIISACWNLIKWGILWHGWPQVPLLATDLSSLLVAFDAIRANQNGPWFSPGEIRPEEAREGDLLISPRRTKLGRKFPKQVATAKNDVARRVEWRFIIVFDEMNWSVPKTWAQSSLYLPWNWWNSANSFFLEVCQHKYTGIYLRFACSKKDFYWAIFFL